jgi:hypothetical protein
MYYSVGYSSSPTGSNHIIKDDKFGNLAGGRVDLWIQKTRETANGKRGSKRSQLPTPDRTGITSTTYRLVRTTSTSDAAGKQRYFFCLPLSR